jgi:hypothetical protein
VGCSKSRDGAVEFTFLVRSPVSFTESGNLTQGGEEWVRCGRAATQRTLDSGPASIQV